MSLGFDATWPGVSGCVNCSYTCVDGVSPGVATLVVPAQDLSACARIGTLAMSDNERAITVPGMLLDRADVIGRGDQVSLTLLDRRWRWRTGKLDGHFNQRDPYADSLDLPASDYDPSVPDAPSVLRDSDLPVVEATQRPLGWLMARCLEKMGEAPSVAAALATLFAAPPPPEFPEVNWRGANPATELERLCQLIGWRLVYRPDTNDVRVTPLGGPFTIPADLPCLADHPGVDPPEAPPRAVAQAGPTWVTDYLPLEAVGLEVNGDVRPIDELSYKPAAGWGAGVPGLYQELQMEQGECESRREAADLANQYVFKCFRVKIELAGLFLWATGAVAGPAAPPPGWPTEDDGLPAYVPNRDLIVLAPRQYRPQKDVTGNFRSDAPEACHVGFLHRRDTSGIVQNAAHPVPFDGAVTVDPGRGLVYFSKPVYHVARAAEPASTPENERSWERSAARCWVRTSFMVRDRTHYQLVGYEREEVYAAGEPAAVEVVPCPDVQMVWDVDRGVEADLVFIDAKSNRPDVQAALAYALAGRRAQYQTTTATTRTYLGIYAVHPDNGVRQVTWSGGTGSEARTVVSVNTEHANWLPSFKERRFFKRSDNRFRQD